MKTKSLTISEKVKKNSRFLSKPLDRNVESCISRFRELYKTIDLMFLCDFEYTTDNVSSR